MELTRESLDEILTRCPDCDYYYVPVVWSLKVNVCHWPLFPKFNPNQCDSIGSMICTSHHVSLTTADLDLLVDVGMDIGLPTSSLFDNFMQFRSDQARKFLFDCGLSCKEPISNILYPFTIGQMSMARYRRTHVRTVCATFLLSNLLVKMVVAVVWRSSRYSKSWKRVCDD
jgi:hypothetical protein